MVQLPPVEQWVPLNSLFLVGLIMTTVKWEYCLVRKLTEAFD